MSNTLISNQTNNQQVSKSWDLIDITRIILLILIITTHSWPKFFEYRLGDNKAPGYIACEAFYIITGFFVAKKAMEPDSTKWYRYSWRKIWNYLPRFIIAILFGVVTFGIASLIYMKPFKAPIIGVIWQSWFMWFMFISSALLYLLVQKGKSKFMFSCIFIGIACFLIMYFAWPPFICFTKPTDPKNLSAILPVVRGFLRSMGGTSLGIFIYWVWTKTNNKQPHIALQIIASIFNACVGIATFVLIIMFPVTYVDYIVIILFFVFFLLMFMKVGYLSRTVAIPKPVTSWCRKYSFVIYTAHGAWVKFLIVFSEHNTNLYDQTWWLWLFGILCYVGAFLIGIAAEQVYKPVKKHILDKCVKLNSI